MIRLFQQVEGVLLAAIQTGGGKRIKFIHKPNTTDPATHQYMIPRREQVAIIYAPIRKEKRHYIGTGGLVVP